MRIFCCIKQVPGTQDVKIDPEKGTLIRTGIPSIINPVDRNAIELALQFKKQANAKVSVVSMGPPQAEDALIEALAMGADDAYLLTDKKFAGADTLATSYTLSLAITRILAEKSPPEDKDKYLVICGEQAIDGDTAQVGPEIAEELKIPSITYVRYAELKGDKIVAERVLNPSQIDVVETKLPALITVTKEINTPRFPTLYGIQQAFEEKQTNILNATGLDADETKIGLTGSRTRVFKISIPDKKVQSIRLDGSIQEMAKKLAEILKERDLI